MFAVRTRLSVATTARFLPISRTFRPSVKLFSTGGDDLVFEVDQAAFNEKVMQSPVPIVLDCYANWCGPCKQLDPILQKAVRAQNGKVKMAKLDTDKNPELSGALGIKSLPTVYGIANSKMVDSFIGMQSEAQITQFVAKVAAAGSAPPVPENPVKVALSDLENILGSEKAGVKEVKPFYEQLLQFSPYPPEHKKSKEEESELLQMKAYATVGLVKCALEAEDLAEAVKQVALLETNFKKLLDDKFVKQVVSAVKIKENAQGFGELGDLSASAAANPTSCEAVFELAAAQFANGQNEEAVESALKALKMDPNHNDGAPKKLLLDIFEALGPSDPLTKAGRRKMSALIL